ncbi:MAG TPA: amidohydrolase family protein [Xanthobacteraceae bacterium]|jgi:imidazolonepropionase-like amidohydrolase
MRQLKRIWSCLVVAAGLVIAAGLPAARAQAPNAAAVFEGGRLITGDGSTIEDAAFVVENDRFTAVGRRGELPIPAGAVRVNLSGKTVMPTMTDLHGHIGYQNVAAGTMSKEMFTRDNLVDHLQRLAYYGVGAIVSIGDLVDRSDLHGGRTNWGNVPLKLREEVVPGAALFKTAGPGIAWPGAGAQGHPSRADVMYPVTTEDEARAAVADYVRIKPEFIKIWVDNRGGRVKTLTPPLYRTIVAEAHRYNVPVGVHNVTLADAKELMRAGVEGWLHVPVRGGEAVDDELIGIVRNRVARNDHPVMWITPSLHSMWMMASWVSTPSGQHPAWLDDPLLSATYSPEQIGRAFTESQKQNPANRAVAHEFELEGGNAMALRAAGMRIVMGTDTGQIRHWIGYYDHMALESFVAIGMTPAEAIVAATRDSAEIAKVNSGLVAAGRSADFIVLDANPLDNISNSRRINKVYLRGQEVPRAAFAAKWQSEFGHSASTP